MLISELKRKIEMSGLGDDAEIILVTSESETGTGFNCSGFNVCMILDSDGEDLQYLAIKPSYQIRGELSILV